MDTTHLNPPSFASQVNQVTFVVQVDDEVSATHRSAEEGVRHKVEGLPADPISESSLTLEWLSRYLRPRALGGQGHTAHQFTINGLTYPFVQRYNLACVPEPPDRRRYDMLAGLHIPQPGDLLFFFQADPQDPLAGENARRGIRGVWIVNGTPERLDQELTSVVGGVPYLIHDKCPNCATYFSKFGSACVECGANYPTKFIGGKSRSEPVLSCQLSLANLIPLSRCVSDERVYADFSDPGVVWVGRHDNAMGKGKGSTVRHLLPEEARKILRLLLLEPDQHLSPPGIVTPHRSIALTHPDSRPVTDLPLARMGQLASEDELYFALAVQLRTRSSPLAQSLSGSFPPGLTWDNLEYMSPIFPWGYTASAADFVVVLRGERGRSLVFIIECKRDAAHDEAVLQALLYVERVVQVVSLSPDPGVVLPAGETLAVHPIVIAQGRRTPRGPHPEVAIPVRYDFRRTYSTGTSISVSVGETRFLVYDSPTSTTTDRGPYCDSAGLSVSDLTSNYRASIGWQPPIGAVGTGETVKAILSGSWMLARRASGI